MPARHARTRCLAVTLCERALLRRIEPGAGSLQGAVGDPGHGSLCLLLGVGTAPAAVCAAGRANYGNPAQPWIMPRRAAVRIPSVRHVMFKPHRARELSNFSRADRSIATGWVVTSPVWDHA